MIQCSFDLKTTMFLLWLLFLLFTPHALCLDANVTDCDVDRVVAALVEDAKAAAAVLGQPLNILVGEDHGEVYVAWNIGTEVSACVAGLEVSYGLRREDEERQFGRQITFQGIKNVAIPKYFEPATAVTLESILTATGANLMAGPVPLTVSVELILKDSSERLHYGQASFNLASCIDEDGNHRSYGMQGGSLRIQQRSYNTREGLAVVEVGWDEPNCRPRRTDGYQLIYWRQEDARKHQAKAEKWKSLDLDPTSTQRLVEVDLDANYLFQIFAVDADSGSKISIGRAEFTTRDCRKDPAVGYPAIELGDLEWNGDDEMAVVEVKIKDGGDFRDDGCAKSWAVEYWQVFQPDAASDMTKKLSKNQDSVQILIAPNVNMAFNLVIFMVGENETEEVMVKLPRQESQTLRAVASGRCSNNMEDRPQIRETPGVDVAESERSCNITVTWDNAVVTGRPECLEGFFVRAWTMSKRGKRAYSFADFVRAAAKPDDNSITIVTNWPRIYKGWTIRAQVSPTVVGDDYMEISDDDTRIEGVLMEDAATYGDKVGTWECKKDFRTQDWD